MKKILFIFGMFTLSQFLLTSCADDEPIVDEITEKTVEIEVSKTAITLNERANEKVNVVKINGTYEFTIDKKGVCTVVKSADGKSLTITGAKVGTAIVTIIDSMKKTKQLTIVVKEVVENPVTLEIEVSKTTITLDEGANEKVDVTKVNGTYEFTIDKKEVCTVVKSSDGKILTITGVKVGSAIVTITDSKKKTKVINVTITKAPYKIIEDNYTISNDGVLSGVEDTAIQDGKLVIPSNVTGLINDSFLSETQSKLLKEVVIGGGTLSMYSFQKCHNLEQITFGSGVKKVGAGAFLNCPKLKKIIYKQNSLSSTFFEFPDFTFTESYTNIMNTLILEVPKGTIANFSEWENKFKQIVESK